jgi:hypothetical protein
MVGEIAYCSLVRVVMSSYFRAAEMCGLRSNTEECKRVARRTVSSSTPLELQQETMLRAVKESVAVAATGARRPPCDLVVLPSSELPFAADRVVFERHLTESEEDIASREQKDLLDFQQRAKVEREAQRALEEALAAEIAAEEELRRQKNEEERATHEEHERVRHELRETYGRCFLWNDAAGPTGTIRDRSTIDTQLQSKLENSTWIHEGLDRLCQ